MPEIKKDWWTSKTLHTAFVSFATVLATSLFADPEVAAMVREIVVILLPLLMVILRMVTHKGIK